MVFTRKSREPVWLMRRPDGQVLAVAESGDLYYLVDEITGAKQRLDLQRAVQLWQRGKREGWERLDEDGADEDQADMAWQSHLRLQLGLPDDD